MDEFTNALSCLGAVNAYGDLIKNMNQEFMEALEVSKSAMTKGASADAISDNFHDIFVKYLLKSADIRSRIVK